MKKSISILVFLWISLSLNAQDIHFTQYNYAPLLLNPANTGNSNGDIRAGFHYRNQWRSVSPYPYQTVSVYADKKFYNYTDQVGAGLIFLTDRSGPGNLTTNKIYVSGAYHWDIGKHRFSFGLQPGIVNRTLDNTTYPNQYNPETGRFDLALPNNESRLNDNRTFFDLNTGVVYHFEVDGFKLSVGQAFFHVLQPNESLIKDETIQLPVRYVSHARAIIDLNEKLQLMPSALFMRHQEASEWNMGSLLNFIIVETPTFFAARGGIYYRNNIRSYSHKSLPKNEDAVSLITGFTVNRFDLGIAYDVNISELQEASDFKGALDLVLTYTLPLDAALNKKMIPCRRY